MSEHYFAENPSATSAPSTVKLQLRDLEVDLQVDAGVFSSRGVDLGTRNLLARPLPPTGEGDLLDLGCGYGPIAITLATRYPERKVWAVDVNQRALELTEKNARSLGLANIVTALPDNVAENQRFGGIYSNPPIRIGKDALHALLLQWLPRLNETASAFLVVHKHLGSDSLAKWLASNDFATTRVSSSSGYRILQVHSASAVD